MKKSELAVLVVGSKVENKKTGEVLTINNIVEIDNKVKYELDNNKTIAQTTLSKNYTYVQVEQIEQVEIEQVEIEQVVEVAPVVKPVVEVKPVEVVEQKEEQPQPGVELKEKILAYCMEHSDKYIIKQNSDHTVIKGVNKKNLVEIYGSKKAVNISVRHALYTEDEQMVLDNCRLVGNGTFTLDLKFRVHTINEFIQALNRATEYVVPKRTK